MNIILVPFDALMNEFFFLLSFLLFLLFSFLLVNFELIAELIHVSSFHFFLIKLFLFDPLQIFLLLLICHFFPVVFVTHY